MAKYTSGILMRDKGRQSGYPILSFHCLSKYGWWRCKRYWTLDKWKTNYDLKPPAPGKCFEVEIEL